MASLFHEKKYEKATSAQAQNIVLGKCLVSYIVAILVPSGGKT
jgi:hypothetical protein